MVASPRSIAATSDVDVPSSPAAPEGKSFMSRVGSDDEDGTPVDGAEKSSRGKSKGSQKDANGQSQVGKIRHLKKEDGEPLWREDIQFDFLKAVFDNEEPVFTNSYEPEGIGKQNFADLYIDTMSRSSKTSKVLRDKLLSDREAAKGMAMVCLLVNMGRMNTTLNFFPEMRAQLRTYHAIPSLQAHQDPHAYKQLQDAPRLKSILKGGAEDREEPGSLDKIKQLDTPRTNPVNLIFTMCSTALKVAELHFPRNHEFHDLIMKTQYSSPSRARAFLWLMWFYLESDFTEEGCEENPFGAGVDYDLDVANQGIPELEEMTPEQKLLENVDTESEIEFGREKQRTRAKILELDLAYLNERETKRGKAARIPLPDEGPAILPRIRPSKHDSDRDSTRSTPPPRSLARAVGPNRRGAALKYQIFEGSSPARQPPEGVVARKPRPPTAHQLAVERNRNLRVEYILDRGLRREHHRSRKVRRQNGAIFRSIQRLSVLNDPLEDSDEEDIIPRSMSNGVNDLFRGHGPAGLCLLKDEPDDFGEEANSYAAALRRSTRRLARWSGRENELGIVSVAKKVKQATEDDNKHMHLNDHDHDHDHDHDLNGLDDDIGDTTLLRMHGDDGADVSMMDADEDLDRTEMLSDG